MPSDERCVTVIMNLLDLLNVLSEVTTNSSTGDGSKGGILISKKRRLVPYIVFGYSEKGRAKYHLRHNT